MELISDEESIYISLICSILTEIKVLFSFFSQLLDKDFQELVRTFDQVCD